MPAVTVAVSDVHSRKGDHSDDADDPIGPAMTAAMPPRPTRNQPAAGFAARGGTPFLPGTAIPPGGPLLSGGPVLSGGPLLSGDPVLPGPHVPPGRPDLSETRGLTDRASGVRGHALWAPGGQPAAPAHGRRRPSPGDEPLVGDLPGSTTRSTAPRRGQPCPTEAAVWTRGLTKQYGHRRVVDHLDLFIPTGALSGFVGPNGAGKSTTLRMLLGLVRPSEGEAYVLGEPATSPDRYLGRTGAMIEGPTFHPGLSGRRNLEQLALLRGVGAEPRHGRHRGPGRRRRRQERIDEVLDQVGLTGRAEDRFGTYSLGMKQRLGIAAALLPRPKLLILDEPTNGLDPAGIREIRTLLRDLAGTGMTVFVSSHLLSEVEQICDHLVMIRSGRMLFQGHVADLLAAEDPRILMVPERDDDAVRLAGVLGSAGLRAEIEHSDEARPIPMLVEQHPVVVAHAPEGLAADLNRLAMRAGITLRSIRAHRPNLEETFLKATGEVDGDLTMRGGAT